VYGAINVRTGQKIADQVVKADTAFKRMRGLLGRSSLAVGEGLYLPKCNAIHTFFMRFPIDVLFLTKDHLITHMVHSLVPFRIVWGPWGTRAVLELPGGALQQVPCETGDTIAFLSRTQGCGRQHGPSTR